MTGMSNQMVSREGLMRPQIIQRPPLQILPGNSIFRNHPPPRNRFITRPSFQRMRITNPPRLRTKNPPRMQNNQPARILSPDNYNQNQNNKDELTNKHKTPHIEVDIPVEEIKSLTQDPGRMELLIEVQLFDTEVTCLVDSGSDTNLVSEDLLDILFLDWRDYTLSLIHI